MVIRRLAGGVILGIALLSPSAFSQAPTTAVLGTPPQPSWSALTPTQKSILAPLSSDWDQMENIRRKKWLGIADRYHHLKPDEQQRLQERMREWAKLTPEQRAKVRGTFKDFNQLPAEQKQVVKQKWEAYSNLPTEEKQRIRETSRSAKLLTPPPAVEEPPPPVPADNAATVEKN